MSCLFQIRGKKSVACILVQIIKNDKSWLHNSMLLLASIGSRKGPSTTWLHVSKGPMVAELVECWTFDWRVAGLKSGLESPCLTIYIFSAPYSVPVSCKRTKPRMRSNHLTVPAGLLNIFLKGKVCCLDLLWLEVVSRTNAHV